MAAQLFQRPGRAGATANALKPQPTDDMEVDERNDTVSEQQAPVMAPVQRAVQHQQQTRKEGLVTYYTAQDGTVKQEFWKLNTNSIVIYQETSCRHFVMDIRLSTIIEVKERSVRSENMSYVFSIRAPNLICYVGDQRTRDEAKLWMIAIRELAVAVTHVNCLNITEKYNLEREIGSGQFGTVQAAIRKEDGLRVAIKVVDKHKHELHDQDHQRLRNEARILENLHHVGIVRMFEVCENPSKIYVVMEHMAGDMLEFVLLQPEKRLCERRTRFFIVQILHALKYLHTNHIVHCDLKPENVLIADASPFPQVKLCDFGFAKIISEQSFRKSQVGTPAYLAPEVIARRNYNRSVDIWALGVVIYVSLSGTFPFKNDERIEPQVRNLAFLFPPEHWRHIDLAAQRLITELLQIDVEKRHTTDHVMQHPWFRDNYVLRADIRSLEQRISRSGEERYWTYMQDDENYEEIRMANNWPPLEEIGGNIDIDLTPHVTRM